MKIAPYFNYSVNSSKTPAFGQKNQAVSASDCFVKTKKTTYSTDELMKKMLKLDFYKKDANKMSKRTDIFTPDNLEELKKIKFSGFKTKMEERYKYFLLYNLEDPKKVAEFLEAIKPVKKEVYAEDLEYTKKEAIQYIHNISKNPEELDMTKYLKLIKETGYLLEGPYNLVKGNGYDDLSMDNVEEINKILFGKQPTEQKKALERFEKDTGVKLLMDYNLPLENIEYLKEFVNLENAQGNEICPIIFLTQYVEDSGSYYYGDYILSEPIVNAKGEIDEEVFATLQHENTHFLDSEKLDEKAKAKDSFFYDKPELKELVGRYLGKYSTKDRDEFVAEFRAFVQSNRIQKYQTKDGEIRYRYPLEGKASEEDKDVLSEGLKKVIGLYYKFNGPEIKPNPLAEPSKEYIKKHFDYDFLDVSEKEVSPVR